MAVWQRYPCLAKKQVQDPYSFRLPQVHGASMDSITYIRSVFIREINSVTDNPNIFPRRPDTQRGNFHGQPLVFDLRLSGHRIKRTRQYFGKEDIPAHQRPARVALFLVKDPGLHSGFMIPQYTAAGIVSENKQLCTPSSIDTIPSSNNQEDHVSMGPIRQRNVWVVDNLEKVLAIELMTATQVLSSAGQNIVLPRLKRS